MIFISCSRKYLLSTICILNTSWVLKLIKYLNISENIKVKNQFVLCSYLSGERFRYKLPKCQAQTGRSRHDNQLEDIWWINNCMDWQMSTHPTQITLQKTSLTSFKSEMDGWTTCLSINPFYLLCGLMSNTCNEILFYYLYHLVCVENRPCFLPDNISNWLSPSPILTTQLAVAGGWEQK